MYSMGAKYQYKYRNNTNRLLDGCYNTLSRSLIHGAVMTKGNTKNTKCM